MEEGSPGVFLKTYRSMKRVRVGDECAHVCNMDDQPNPSLMEHVMSESEHGPVPNSTFGAESFRDKLMNKQKWSLKGAWKLIDLVNDYYVVKFDLEEDLNFVLTSGPWIVAGQYLNIEYEGLPDIRYHCGRYGHKRENCELRVKVPADVNTESTVGDDSDKMKTGSAGASVNDPLADSSLRGPWMNVQFRRRPKPDFKAFSGKGFGAKVKGSCFDALRNLSDNFGRDEAASDVFVEQDKSNFNSSFLPDVEHGKKVWTKTKNAKPVFRSSLNDISNKPFEGKVLGDMSFRKGGGPSKVSSRKVTRIGNMVVQGKKFDCSSPVNDQITSWVTDQKSHHEKGVYIFGHQPPNISEKDASNVGSTDSEGDKDMLNSNVSDSLCQADKMDLLEGQAILCGENLAGNTFNDGGGAASTKFKTNMMDLIHSHHMDILFICEPHISGGKATSIAQSLGFSNFEILDATGFSGGLWLLWDATKVHVDILGTSDQSISASVAWPGQSPWLFIAVYASPCGIKRAKLWEYLSFIADCQHLPWLIAGDFNKMLNVNDKLGGVSVCRLKASLALRPFRFEAMWLHHAKFNDFISEAWGPGDGTAVEKTFALIEHLKHWNINQEEKSRIIWLQDGDRNTKFFHTTTIIRRRRNKIERLKNANGIWIEEANSLKILAVDHFSNLFSTTSLGDYVIDLPNLSRPVDVVNLHGLVQPINMTEVKTSLFNIGGLKAPGVDRFPACFYQSQWN
ncbi:uncharacterized protein LOC109949309 [Prunus persica]|uniref:uncharacterized protein LOC109949309 n=1 Tax=Prunus persica TaxID=3760 RepID=UPI0009AB89C0|nr:uncharacterized protein LOC109949309 [Prunus persica]